MSFSRSGLPVHGSLAVSVLSLDSAVAAMPKAPWARSLHVPSAYAGQGQGASRPGLMAHGGGEEQGKGTESLGGGYTGGYTPALGL